MVPFIKPRMFEWTDMNFSIIILKFKMTVGLLILPIFSLLFHHIEAIRVISTKYGEMPHPKSHFTVDNIATDNDYTLCFRFMTYKFLSQHGGEQLLYGLFGSKHHAECNLFTGNCDNLKRVTVKGEEIDAWLPLTWNTFCGKAEKGKSVIFLNGLKLMSFDKYFPILGDTVFMNGILSFFDPNNMRYPLYGSITDVNVWGRFLTDHEIKGWSKCFQEPSGIVHSWANISINMYHLEEHEIPLEEICYQKDDIKYKAFHLNLDMWESIQFCNRLGRMAVYSNNSTGIKMQEALAKIDKPFGNTGYTDYQQEGTWLEYGTQNELQWSFWAPNEPNDWKHPNGFGEDCALFNMETMEAYDVQCTTTLPPICEISSGQVKEDEIKSLYLRF